MMKLRLILASAAILVGLAACNGSPTPTPSGVTTTPAAGEQPPPTIVITPIPESAYPSPSGYPSPSP